MTGKHSGEREQLVTIEVMDDENADTRYRGYQTVCLEHGVCSRNHMSEHDARRLAVMHLSERHIDWRDDVTYRPRTAAPCGTYQAYKRHVDHGEPVDETCEKARADREPTTTEGAGAASAT